MAESSSVPQVLVTGASGFIASHIVQQLLTGGQVRVRGTVRSLSNEAKVKPLQELVPDATYPLELVEADLLNEDSWKEAVKGCTYVLHVASPVDIRVNESILISQAVNGTLNVLKACAESGTVKRVVLTSSVAAISNGMRGDVDRIYTESDWSQEELCGGYERSKLLAERAAWDFVDKLEEDKKFELVVINPGGCIGPLLTNVATSTLELITALLNRDISMLLNVSFPMVDVRDVAAGHIVAMEKPEAAGNRYILNNNNMWMREIANVMRNEFEPQGYSIPSSVAPKALLWIAKFFSKAAGWFYPGLGRVIQYSNEKMRNELGIQPRDVNHAIIDGCYSLIEKGIVSKRQGYTGPPS